MLGHSVQRVVHGLDAAMLGQSVKQVVRGLGSAMLGQSLYSESYVDWMLQC